ncbi:MAG: sulfur carrier protein ThiS [Solirubrobacteraceae bacterium]
MLVSVNGRPREVPEGATVASVLALADLAPGVREAGAGARGVAVAVDGEVVPRRRWASVELREGDGVEVLAAIAGG